MGSPSQAQAPPQPSLSKKPSISIRRMAGQSSHPSSSASTPKAETATPPLSLDISAAAAISPADGSVQVPLKQSVQPREAGAPSLNATASPLPVTQQGVTPPLTTSGAKVNKQQQKQADDAHDRGYEGEAETQTDAVGGDESDDTTGPNSARASRTNSNAGLGRRPTLSKRGESGILGHDYADSQQAAAAASPSLASQRQQADTEKEHPLSEHIGHRNRNPSSASHTHPTLPVRPGKNGHGGAKARSPSVTSTRSAEATSHPFPTPGFKPNNGFQFDKWKSVEEMRLEEDERHEKHWKRWGPYLSERQWVRCGFFVDLTAPSSRRLTAEHALDHAGDGPRGLLGQRRRVDSFPARPRPLSRLPLGRRRHRRTLGQPCAPLLLARHVERRRPDPQGTPVRHDRSPGQPRRGRQGTVLVPRFDPDPLVHEDAVQVPAAAVPVRAVGPRVDQPQPRRSRVRDHRHGRVRRQPLLGCLCRGAL